MSVPDIEDYSGFPEGVSGYELGPMVQEQAAGEAAAGAVILPTGTRARRLGVPGEEHLDGHGISHCARCDGILFSERTVGESAAATPAWWRRWS